MFWNKLKDEINLNYKYGITPVFWWRDDDAIQKTALLEQLLKTAGETPINLAVIPKFADQSLVDLVENCKNVTISQHGWAHENHAPETMKKAEFLGGRNMQALAEDIQTGYDRIKALFPDQFVPVFVPPWNRIEEAALEGLVATGIKVLSTFNARTGHEAAPIRINTHMDIMDWRGSRGFAGHELVLGQAIKHLRDKREGLVDPNEPTGLLTHHLVHDEDCWNFLHEFNDFILQDENAYWVSPMDCLEAQGFCRGLNGD